MKTPPCITEVTISPYQSKGPLPPLGFVEMEEGNDGAGNNYGLYWQMGKEDYYPMVCWFDHDAGQLEPRFPTLSSFIRWNNLDDKDTFEFEGEEDLFFPYYNKARLLNKRKKHEEAIEYLEYALHLFGEYTRSWYLVNLQFLKTNDIHRLTKYFPKILTSTWAFGAPEHKEVNFMKDSIALLEPSTDPIINLYNQLHLENNWKSGLQLNFDVLKEIIAEYHHQKDFLSALKLKQNLGYTMFYQNSQIIKEHNFDNNTWQAELEDYSRTYLNDRRYKLNKPKQ